MNEIMEMVKEIVGAPWAIPALVAVVFLIIILVMRRRYKSEIEDWSNQCGNLRNAIDSLDREQRRKNAEIEEGKEALAQAKDEFDAQLKAKDEDMTAQLTAKDEDVTAQLTAKDEDVTAQLTAKDEYIAAQLKAKDEYFAEQMKAKEEQVAAMQAQVDQWNRNRDAIVSDARKAADQIVGDAHETADRILDEAARRLAESEEEVRQNRMIAAGSLTDARKRISEMLLTAASELCKGIPSASPIGYAPVYSIDDAAQKAPKEDVFYEAEVHAEEIDEDHIDMEDEEE